MGVRPVLIPPEAMTKTNISEHVEQGRGRMFQIRGRIVARQSKQGRIGRIGRMFHSGFDPPRIAPDLFAIDCHLVACRAAPTKALHGCRELHAVLACLRPNRYSQDVRPQISGGDFFAHESVSIIDAVNDLLAVHHVAVEVDSLVTIVRYIARTSSQGCFNRRFSCSIIAAGHNASSSTKLSPWLS